MRETNVMQGEQCAGKRILQENVNELAAVQAGKPGCRLNCLWEALGDVEIEKGRDV